MRILTLLFILYIQEESARNKQNRANKKMMHITGKKTFAQIKDQLKVIILLCLHYCNF